jgi:hypothetical protein
METQVAIQSRLNLWLYAGAGFSALAGLIHIIVTPEHIGEWIGYGLFFVVVWTCQLLFALILIVFRPIRREILWAGILGNLAIIVVWAFTRTIGVPLGPMAGGTEPIGTLDVLSKIAEMGVIACLAGAIRTQTEIGKSTG